MAKESEIHPHVAEERADLFHAASSQDTEFEYIEFLAGLVRILKPNRVLETGTGNCSTSYAIARVLEQYNLGELVTVDHKHNEIRMHNRIVYVQEPSLQFLATTDSKPFDFMFLDTALEIRAKELEIILRRGLYSANAFVAIHDTSQVRTTRKGTSDIRTKIFWNDFNRLQENYKFEYIQFPYSRGMTLVQL